MPTLTLRKPLDRVLRAGHPWIYRDALQAHDYPPGTLVRVQGKAKKPIGWGITEDGPIGVRLWTTEGERLDAGLVRQRLEGALSLRARIAPADTDCLRLVHGEGDRMPGIVCDRYGELAVLKLDGEGVRAIESTVHDALRDALPTLGVHTLIARSGSRDRGTGNEAARVVFGTLPEQPLRVREHGMQLAVDVVHGQKTGLFLDQRETRLRVRTIARGLSVLNLYGYTGGFSVAAALGGAKSVTTVDTAAPALALAEETFGLNQLDPSLHRTLRRDALELCAELAQTGERFDLVIADPPSFAPSEASRPAALASYARLHELALALVTNGGYYLAGSCSSHVDATAFRETLEQGAQRARRVLQVLEHHGAPACHPRLLAFPEGDYLKVVLARAL